MSSSSRFTIGRWLSAIALGWTLLAIGCAPRQANKFAAREDLKERLPESQQQQLAEQLTRFFGTPDDPHIRIPDPAGDDAAEEITLVDTVSPAKLRLGARVYNRRCAGCHGVTGDGNGEAAPHLHPKPRDYRNGVFKFTSTPYGAKPHRSDLIRIIQKGAKGTSMPTFRFLPDEEVSALVDYVILLSQRGEAEIKVAQTMEIDFDEDTELTVEEFLFDLDRIRSYWAQAESQVVTPLTQRPAYDDASIKKGRHAFLTLSAKCASCHKEDGTGQTEWLSSEFIARPEAERGKVNYDAWGNVAPAADLTAGMLHGGRRPVDIYRRIYTGINGTPMPAFADALKDQPETIWHLTHYILSIVERHEPKEARQDL